MLYRLRACWMLQAPLASVELLISNISNRSNYRMLPVELNTENEKLSSKQRFEFLVHPGIPVSERPPPPHATLGCEPTRASLQVATNAPGWCSVFPASSGKRPNRHARSSPTLTQ